MPCPSAAYGPRCGAGGGQLYRSTNGQVLVSAEGVIAPPNGRGAFPTASLWSSDGNPEVIHLAGLPRHCEWIVAIRQRSGDAGSTSNCKPEGIIHTDMPAMDDGSNRQKIYFSPNCISRLLTTVDPIRPKSAAPSAREGAENCGVFRKLNASKRN